MKEFWKWAEKHSLYDVDDCEKGWRAALEWVKRELPRAEAGFINPDLGLGEILKKELEE